METQVYQLESLFAQLGLPSTNASIERFMAEHAPLSDTLWLHEAPFWSASQADFLQQAIKEDADWAIIVDELSVMLRART